MFLILSIFWFIRTSKMVLFWIYLWQLKEYHVGRFLDHFTTYKGKKLIFRPLQIFKVILAGLFILSITRGGMTSTFSLISALFLIYFIESIFAFRAFFAKKLRIPVFTKKTVVLLSSGLLVLIAFPLILFLIVKNIFWLAFALLVFDIFTPKIVSLIVLSFQPLVVLLRNKVLEKAKKKREDFKNLLVIGITGSYGKTSTKEFLFEILSEKFKVLKTEKHINAEIGIAETILNKLKKSHEIFIAELGAYEKGKIKQVCKILKPKIGILTGINEQHMATFKSQRNIITGKYELIRSLPKTGLAVFNGGNEYCFKLFQKTNKPKKFYSTKQKVNNKQSDIWAKDIQVGKEVLSFKVFSKDGDSTDFKVNSLGAQNVSNILGAVCVARKLGMTLKEISKACRKIKPDQEAIRFKEGKKKLNIIESTYSANPDGVISHLEYLKTWKNRKTIIMPCLIELGKASKKVHQRIGEKIGEVCDFAIITTKDRFKEIKKGAIKSGMKNRNILFIENPIEIIKKTRDFCQKDDVVLLEGRLPSQLIGYFSL